MSIRAKPVKQKRSEEKRDRLIHALEALLLKKDFEEISIAEIAARARVPSATIYQRFSNRDAAASILIELYLRRVEEWARSPEGCVDISSARSLYGALMMIGRSGWREVESIGHIMRPAYLYSRLRPDLIGETWKRQEQAALSGFQNLITHYKSEITADQDDKAAGMIAYFFNFMLLGKLLHNEWGGWDILQNEETFAKELADFAYGYLANDNIVGKRSA